MRYSLKQLKVFWIAMSPHAKQFAEQAAHVVLAVESFSHSLIAFSAYSILAVIHVWAMKPRLYVVVLIITGLLASSQPLYAPEINDMAKPDHPVPYSSKPSMDENKTNNEFEIILRLRIETKDGKRIKNKSRSNDFRSVDQLSSVK